MGCCNAVNIIQDFHHEKLINLILSSMPLNTSSFKFCRSQFKTAMVEINSNSAQQSHKKTSSKKLKMIVQLNDTAYEVKEDKYIIVLEFLMNQKYPHDKLNKSGKTTQSLVRKTTKIDLETNRTTTEPNKTNLLERSTTNSSELDSFLNLLYFCIVPSFSSLFDMIFKNNPEASFLFFILGFSKDGSYKKAEALINIVDILGIKFTMTNFISIIQSYIEMNIQFSMQIFLAAKNTYLAVKQELTSKYNITLDSSSMADWEEFNRKAFTEKAVLASSFAHTMTKELLNIVLTETKPDGIAHYKKNLRSNLDHLSMVEVCELIVKKYHDYIIQTGDLVVLLNVHTYLFDAPSLRVALLKYKPKSED